MTFAVRQKGEPMLKVPYGQDPYSVIGKYIRDHITTIEDIIAVIEINDITTNQLFMVDMNEENYFIWDNDWYEGEKDVALIDFFPVSEAINPSFQIDSIESNDTISRRAAIDEIRKCRFVVDAIEKIRVLPPAQSDCTDCKKHGGDWECDHMHCRKGRLQSVQPEQQWIPVSERLPEEGVSILISVGGMYSAEGCLRWDKDWNQFRWSAIQDKEVVDAWMPLPEPYKERREE